MAVAVLLAGCTSLPFAGPDPAPDDETGVAASEPSSAPPSPTPSPTPAPSPSTTPSPTPEPSGSPTPDDEGLEPCPREDRDEMAAAVRGQLAAITADDWDGALSFTSTSFRSSVDAARFERIIVDDFPVVADAVGADVARCLRSPTVFASLLVTVEDTDGRQQDLVYLFELEEGTWRIGGAVPDGADGDAGGITA